MSFLPGSEHFVAGIEPISFGAIARPAVSVVVPCYNEEANLHVLVDRVELVCKQVCQGDYEIVLVNDGSSDQSWPIICELADDRENVVGVNLSRNHGHQLALSAGLQICCGEAVLVLDADLQDPPELLPSMLEKLN
ncbi:MAG: glycosyltransferase family 2 protein [Sphingobium sp.]